MATETFYELAARQNPQVECLEANPDIFFADEHDEDEQYGKSEQAIAVTICNRCPIKRQCADYAMRTNQEHGVWGGMLPVQRRVYMAKRASGIKERERQFGKK